MNLADAIHTLNSMEVLPAIGVALGFLWYMQQPNSRRLFTAAKIDNRDREMSKR